MLKKAKVALLFVLVLLLAATPVFANGDYDEYDAQDTQEPTVTIFHTNDVHGRFLPSNTAMGIATIATIYAETPNALLVDAGDTIHGLPFATINRGMDIVELMNAAGYDLFVPGNHDFNFGTDRLLELEAVADFDFIAANVIRDGELLFDDIAIREINGITLGFFGLAHPNTPVLTNPTNVVGVSFTDPIEAARDAVERLQGMDVDVIIALAHLGSGARNEYRVDGYAVAVAEAVAGIDLIIDGHSHSLHENGLLVGDTLIVQAGDHGNNLGRVDIFAIDGEITINASQITRDEAVENFDADEDIQALIEEIQARQAEEMDVVVAYLPEQLDNEFIRSQEMPLGNLIADAIRWQTGTDIAFTNGGGIRDILPAGDVTKGDIISVLPFGNYVVTLEITPAILAAAMENAVSALPGGGRFPQVSGFSFAFNPEAEAGERLVSITLNGEDLDLTDDTTTFTIATNNFIAAGGDAFEMFVDLPILLEFGNLDEVLIAYIPEADLEGLAVEGRIVEVAEAATLPAPIDAEVEDVTEEVAQEELVIDEAEEVIEALPIEEPIEADPLADLVIIYVDGVQFVAFRAFANALGYYTLAWDSATGTVTVVDVVVFTVVEAGGFNDNGTVFVPLQFAMEQLVAQQ
ncbi:MAG: bifunctional metallophosphatase/5'-nucleotidase [Defluviitaleaceae bacterium]|nr:bifunctional metallophosphatase/5'-nucleotidase [Defluviitaleaceae bacterium]